MQGMMTCGSSALQTALGVHKYLHQGCPLLSDWNYGIVNEDEGVNPRVRDGPRRQRFEDIEAHHRTNVGVLEQDDLPLTGLDLRGHGVLHISLESYSSRCHVLAPPKSSRCGCTLCRRMARSPCAHSGTATLAPRACARPERRCSGHRAGSSVRWPQTLPA